MNKGFIEELKWRGLFGETTPNVEEELVDMPTAYIGTDPTGGSLHLGHLCAFMLARLFQKYGGRPIILIGGATGMIGDPSFKSSERNLMSQSDVEKNSVKIKEELEKIVITDESVPNHAIMVNNYDWMKDYSFLDFSREIGKAITINYMMSKESVKKRLERDGEGISFLEFTYQLIQGNDFLHLNDKYGCSIQFCGLDQKGNATTGISLIHKLRGKDAHFIACPLITDASGKKIGKTDGNASVWLDRDLTSPYKMYQYFMNVSDDMAEKMIKIFTLLSKEEIDAIIEEHNKNPHARLLHNKLAEEVITMIHSHDDYVNSVVASKALFDKNIESLLQLDEKTFSEVFEGVPTFNVSREEIEKGIPILDFLTLHEVMSSKGNARKAVLANSISLNKDKKNDLGYVVSSDDVIGNGFILVQHGKKQMFLFYVK